MLRLFFQFLCLGVANFAIAQGCSDAGFCTMGAMKPDQFYNKRVQIRLRSIEFSQYVGLTRFGDVVVNYTGDVNVGITERSTFQIKLPYVIAMGPLITNTGVGDMSLSFTQNIISRPAYQVGLTVGGKIPTGEVNTKTPEGRPLPMYNQTGLGTYDFVTGLSIATDKWLFATGYQHAFGTSRNEFLWNPWTGHELEAEARAYPRAKNLKRGEDVMLRIERNFRFVNWNVNVGLLPIYRINNDYIQLPVTEPSGETNWTRTEVEGSKGLALTLLTGGGYQFSTRSGIKVMNGFRLVKRKINPDGLSREMVFNVGYVFRF